MCLTDCALPASRSPSTRWQRQRHPDRLWPPTATRPGATRRRGASVVRASDSGRACVGERPSSQSSGRPAATPAGSTIRRTLPSTGHPRCARAGHHQRQRPALPRRQHARRGSRLDCTQPADHPRDARGRLLQRRSVVTGRRQRRLRPLRLDRYLSQFGYPSNAQNPTGLAVDPTTHEIYVVSRRPQAAAAAGGMFCCARSRRGATASPSPTSRLARRSAPAPVCCSCVRPTASASVPTKRWSSSSS